MAYFQQLYEKSKQFDPAYFIADVRFPEIKRRLVEIEAVQLGSVQNNKCASRGSYAEILRQLLEDYTSGHSVITYEELAQLFRCFMYYSTDSMPNYNVPNLTARISTWINDMSYVGASESQAYKYYSLVSSGLDLARIKTTNSSSLSQRDNLLINEVWIGMVYLDTLKGENMPYFKYIYGAYTCGALDPTTPNMAQACCGGGGVFYSLEEKIDSATTLANWLDDRNVPYLQYSLAYIQMIKAFERAAGHGVTDFEPRRFDILMRRVPIEFKVTNDLKLKATQYPIIIDFTRCNARPLLSSGRGSSYVPTSISATDVELLRGLFYPALVGSVDEVRVIKKFISEYPYVENGKLDLTIRDGDYRRLLIANGLIGGATPTPFAGPAF